MACYLPSVECFQGNTPSWVGEYLVVSGLWMYVTQCFILYLNDGLSRFNSWMRCEGIKVKSFFFSVAGFQQKCLKIERLPLVSPVFSVTEEFLVQAFAPNPIACFSLFGGKFETHSCRTCSSITSFRIGFCLTCQLLLMKVPVKYLNAFFVLN